MKRCGNFQFITLLKCSPNFLISVPAFIIFACFITSTSTTTIKDFIDDFMLEKGYKIFGKCWVPK